MPIVKRAEEAVKNDKRLAASILLVMEIHRVCMKRVNVAGDDTLENEMGGGSERINLPRP